MKSRRFFILNVIVYLFLIQTSFGQSPDWLTKVKSLVLLTSTRVDSRQVFGMPTDDKETYVEYFDIKEGRVTVLYASGKCVKRIIDNKEVLTGWKVSEWTIIEISIKLKKHIKPKKLKVNFTNFEKYISGYPGEVSYSNSDLGLDYNLYKGKIRSISYTPPKEFDNLLCSQIIQN